ncbi:Abi family protein [Asticcacaulis excentricus]|uniref:Abi family protein n=1 Tax=Asticcacaulis excentricus TaxID=78587 RepID=UPI000F81927C|nr:Abi family protein [Asticcacaulis excentricus]
MQLTNLPHTKDFASVERFLQTERLSRYYAASKGNKTKAFAHYIWNCDLSQYFYIPLHFAEIGSRNAINLALIANLGPLWFSNSNFVAMLDPRFSTELGKAIQDETKQHGASLTAHHIVSALTFGFWEHLLTKRFDRLLWNKGIALYFPGAPAALSREDLRTSIEGVRRWRNRIAHHRAIFDKSPSRKYQQVVELIMWACPTTCAWVKSVTPVHTIINQRPK